MLYSQPPPVRVVTLIDPVSRVQLLELSPDVLKLLLENERDTTGIIHTAVSDFKFLESLRKRYLSKSRSKFKSFAEFFDEFNRTGNGLGLLTRGNGRECLMRGAIIGNTALVVAAAPRIDSSDLQSIIECAMKEAAYNGHLAIFEWLNHCLTHRQLTPSYEEMVRAAASGKHCYIVKHILKKTTLTDVQLNKVLESAAESGDCEIVEYIINLIASTKGNVDYNRVLVGASASGHFMLVISAVGCLMQYNIDPDWLGSLFAAVDGGQLSIAKSCIAKLEELEIEIDYNHLLDVATYNKPNIELIKWIESNIKGKPNYSRAIHWARNGIITPPNTFVSAVDRQNVLSYLMSRC